MKNYFVYIMASQRNGTLYIGMTNDIARRIFEHKNNLADSFTKKYKVHNLVYFEEYADIDEAKRREKSMKEWQRAWKIRRIEEINPEWKDLYLKLNA